MLTYHNVFVCGFFDNPHCCRVHSCAAFPIFECDLFYTGEVMGC